MFKVPSEAQFEVTDTTYRSALVGRQGSPNMSAGPLEAPPGMLEVALSAQRRVRWRNCTG